MIDQKLAPITQFAGGYDFATVLKAYWRGSEDSNNILKEAAVRWLRADARKDLGVRNIIDDDNIYESLKSLACLVRIIFDQVLDDHEIVDGCLGHGFDERLDCESKCKPGISQDSRMIKTTDKNLVSLDSSLQQHIALTKGMGLNLTSRLLAMALMEIRLNLNGISQLEVKQLCERIERQSLRMRKRMPRR
jgi:hypothetical protein